MSYLEILIIIIILLIILKIYVKLSLGWDKSFTCLVGKTAIVTGANTGIGFYTAMDFAKRGAKVILACRNKEKAEEAREKIIEITGNPNIIVMLYDASSFDSVRSFAKEFNETEDRLDILVNNAGAAGLKRTETIDGNNSVMQINHFSSFLLTVLLLDKLRASAPSRIINVSSELFNIARLHPDNLNRYPEELNWCIWMADYVNYGNSKLCNVCFTAELAKRLRGTGITTYSLHPGAIQTEIWRSLKWLGQTLVFIFAMLSFKTSLEGAQTTIYVSVSPDVESLSGKYFMDCSVKSLPSKVTEDMFLKRIWDNTVKIINLTSKEKENIIFKESF